MQPFSLKAESLSPLLCPICSLTLAPSQLLPFLDGVGGSKLCTAPGALQLRGRRGCGQALSERVVSAKHAGRLGELVRVPCSLAAVCTSSLTWSFATHQQAEVLARGEGSILEGCTSVPRVEDYTRVKGWVAQLT